MEQLAHHHFAVLSVMNNTVIEQTDSFSTDYSTVPY